MHGPVASSTHEGMEGSTAGGRAPRESIACGVAEEAVTTQGACWAIQPQQDTLWDDVRVKEAAMGRLRGREAPHEGGEAKKGGRASRKGGRGRCRRGATEARR